MSKIAPPVLSFLSILLLAASLPAATVSTDWCDLTTPDAAAVGQRMEVTVAYRGLPAGQKLFCDLHWNKGPSFGGVNAVLVLRRHRD